MSSVEHLIEISEDLYQLLEKTSINHKKCPKVRLTGGYLQTRIKCVEEYWDSFRDTHKTIINSTAKEQRGSLPYFKEDLHSQFEELFLELKSDLTDKLESLRSARNTSSSRIEHVSSEMEASGSIEGEVHLPKINLPTFSGAYEDWQSFEDVFLSLIHKNKRLSEVEKLHYLKSCVAGEARNAIKNFQVIEKNYGAAWDTLRNRYSHKRLVVDAILKRLFSSKKIHTQSASQLKLLIDNTNECLSNLQSLDISTTFWDPILVFETTQKLDPETHKEWETIVSKECNKDLPSFKRLIDFLECNIQTLVLIAQPAVARSTKERSFHTNSVQITCDICNKNHFLFNYKDFAKLEATNRRQYVKDHRLCYNCLSSSHSVYNCKQKTSCRICGKRHHSLLHLNSEEKKMEIGSHEVKNNTPGPSSLHTNVKDEHHNFNNISLASHLSSGHKRALLATALVPVRSCSGRMIVLRALINSGSQASFISTRAVQSLRLNKTLINATVTGVGSTTTTVSHVVQLEVLSRYDSEFSLPVKAYVLASHVTTKLPGTSIKPKEHWSHLEALTLADPQYFIARKIDILLGVEVYIEIIKNNLIKGPPGSPSAQETSLGWILFGKINNDISHSKILVMHHNLEVDIDNMLRNLWSIEETRKREFTAEERKCEQIYLNNYNRFTDGRYIVKLPLKDSVEDVGETKEIALKRLHLLEKRLEKKPQLKEDYNKIIQEYIDLQHMELVPEEDRKKKAIYLPHHAVIKEESKTTRIRIVFDASCKSSTGISLNDILMTGPQLQEDLRNLVMRWRLKPICFVAGIQKMYRMILVKEEDADLQRILWRKNIDEEVEEYRILRVTFGTASAPYLAVKTLIQLADDEGKECQEAAKVIKEDFYVDDCMSGCFTVKEAIELSKETIEILSKGGFILQKWASNSKEFLDRITTDGLTVENDRNTDECIIQTLGLTWNIATDSFQYQLKLPQQPQVITKRNILADIQRLFDPLGWLGAAIIPAKILIQKLWMKGLGWDEYVGDTLKEEWISIRNNFENLNQVKIGRWIKTEKKELDNITLHDFSDASNKAYCAVVYYRVETKDGEVKTGIVASKTRVAPVKPLSIPRLELCGAVLLARLLTQVREAMRLPVERIFAWTDSTVVLSWLCGDPLKWKVFVSNRVVEILDNLSNSQWFHVHSNANPADIGSRGVELNELIKNKLWWEGPDWLKDKEIHYSRLNITTTDIDRKKINLNLKIEEENITINFENFTISEELLRVIVYCRRFLNSKKNSNNIYKAITVVELEESLKSCLKIAQKASFTEDIDRLASKKYIKKNSRLKSLNPYLDHHNILRVGGRLRNSSLEDEVKHPIILDSKCKLAALLIRDAHKNTIHGGIQLMLSYIRSKYWIIGVKNALKAFIHKCIVCTRHKAAIRTQVMGDLPEVRTTPARAFLHSGVDFAGSLQVLMSKGRGAKSNKAFIAIFVCMATKAIHLELVGDLSSESFIGAFHRFVARRGRCTHMWSDQGRNFIGANKQLVEAWKMTNLELPGHLSDVLTSEGTQWHFIPPYSPNFGLWEAGVKSVKHHLRRILTARFTFEEMTTTLCQIEACLNSRPLIPIDTTDPDFEILTPGHFLIGEPPVTIPNPDLRNISLSRLSRWQYVQRLVRDFWHRWQNEYLSRLQERPKWLKHIREFEIGDIVLLKDEQLPPGKWPLGRVVAKHPGSDNITRVYSIKCANGIVKRSISKLCFLPIETN